MTSQWLVDLSSCIFRCRADTFVSTAIIEAVQLVKQWSVALLLLLRDGYFNQSEHYEEFKAARQPVQAKNKSTLKWK